MPRPVAPPRLYWDAERETWCILHMGKRTRLGLARGETDSAQIRLAEYTLDVARTATAPTHERPASRVLCEEVLERYLARRTDADPAVRVKSVKRPRELGQRIAKLAGYWGGRPVSAVNDATCEAFAAHVGRQAYARRCLADFQSALNEARRGGILREVITVTLPRAPRPREDYMTGAEARAFVLTCWRHRDTQLRATREGPRLVVGRKRPWAHLIRFLAVAIATCSRSSRVFEASYQPEPGRPYVDLDAGLLFRMAVDEEASHKRAPPVRLNARLCAAMRRWSSDRVVGGREIKGDRYVVQWAGKPADCKGAFSEAIKEAVKSYPELFKRRDGTPKKLVRHSLRHTGITWLAMDPELTVEQICAFAGITRKVFDSVYAHHHEAAQAAVVKAQARKRGRPERR